MTNKINSSTNQVDCVDARFGRDMELSNEMLVSVRNVFSIIYRKKYWIILSVVISMSITLYYAVNMKEVWMAKAVVKKPNYETISKLTNNVASVLKFLKIEDNSIKIITSEKKIKVDPIDETLDFDSLYRRFLVNYETFDNKIEFISSSSKYKDGLNLFHENGTSSNNEVMLINLAKNIGLEQEGKPGENKFRLTFKSQSRDDSLKLLNEYIAFINYKVSLEVREEIKNLVEAKMLELESEKKFLMQKINLIMDRNMQVNPALDNLTKLDFESNVLEINIKIGMLKEYLANQQTLEFEAISYLMQPRGSIKPETPSVKFLLFLSVIFGFISGLILVLISSLFEKEKL
ncbi:hypothetical protein RAL73_002140 [Vibrio cholerae]|nr:hypothetical protein [Vibrio cholerae]